MGDRRQKVTVDMTTRKISSETGAEGADNATDASEATSSEDNGLLELAATIVGRLNPNAVADRDENQEEGDGSAATDQSNDEAAEEADDAPVSLTDLVDDNASEEAPASEEQASSNEEGQPQYGRLVERIQELLGVESTDVDSLIRAVEQGTEAHATLTKKTTQLADERRELEDALAIYRLIEQDPAGAAAVIEEVMDGRPLSELASQVKPTQKDSNESAVGLSEEALAAQVERLLEEKFGDKLTAAEQIAQQQQADAARRQVTQVLREKDPDLSDEEVDAVIQYALRMGVTEVDVLPDILDLMRLKQQQKEQERLRARQAAPGRSSSTSQTVKTKEKPPANAREAVERAVARAKEKAAG